MGLSDLAVFSEYTYDAMTEVLAQQVELFNAASLGTMVLSAAANQGDYSDRAFWKKIGGLVRRRNAYGTGAVASKKLEHLVDTMVKVAAGTPPVDLPPSQFTWIQRNPEEGGAIYGQQLAADTLADMLNTAIMAFIAALNGEAAVNLDVNPAAPDFATLNTGASKFGDRSSELRAWLMHSDSMFQIFGNALTNTNHLFTFGTVNVRQDGFGRPFIVTDSSSLTYADPDGAGAKVAGHYIAGLTPAAIVVEMNEDFDQNVQTSNGDENIQRSIQSEWTYNLGIKGYAWDKTSGGKSPNDAALATAANWDKYATDYKDTAGVLISCK